MVGGVLKRILLLDKAIILSVELRRTITKVISLLLAPA